MFSKLAILCAIVCGVLADGYIGHHHAPQPYSFGYSVKDHHGEQHRHESGDGGHAVKGSYGFTDDRGVHRQVDYVADHGGFRAQVKTNEPGTAKQDPAAVKMISSAHPYFGAHGVYGGHGAGGYGGHGYGGGYGGHGYGAGYDGGYAGHGYGLGWAGHGGYGYGGHGLWH
ncbi:cuticle protein 14-like [Stegodyphus dumicola]|uniref:cuticle protein 14-like n=1 Tax=Stegodyphus dumicola TaxID=202533 RepID=UPI0015A89C14|nr:cuticle protein 14-like [Stegodyphus dumicola]